MLHKTLFMDSGNSNIGSCLINHILLIYATSTPYSYKLQKRHKYLVSPMLSIMDYLDASKLTINFLSLLKEMEAALNSP